MHKFTFVLIGVLALTVVVTSACSGASASSSAPPAAATTAADGTQQITVSVSNSMSFEPSNIAVRAGQPVQLTLTNTGETAHDFTLKEGVSQPVKVSVQGGETASGTFTIATPGRYSFECSMPGHALAGMKGSITVQ